MVQEPESADFDQMPRQRHRHGPGRLRAPARADARGASHVCATTLCDQRSGRRRSAQSSPDLLNRILVLLKARTRYDFRSYRKNMLLRRIQRRMGLWQVERMDAYLDLLRENHDESHRLVQGPADRRDRFFPRPRSISGSRAARHPGAGRRGTGATAPLRVWVPGCSSGEEAYSIAMLLIEQFAEAKVATNIQIFASDIDEDALARRAPGNLPRKCRRRRFGRAAPAVFHQGRRPQVPGHQTAA